MAETTLKIAVVGPAKTGKTLLCRALGEQPIMGGDMAYTPTAAVRCVLTHTHTCLWSGMHFVGRGRHTVARRPHRFLRSSTERVQEVSRVLGVDRVKIQFWDCSGSQQFQSYWGVLAKVRLRCAGLRRTCCVRLPVEHASDPALRSRLLCRTWTASSWSLIPRSRSRSASSRYFTATLRSRTTCTHASAW